MSFLLFDSLEEKLLSPRRSPASDQEIMPPEFESLFLKSRTILQAHAEALVVTADAPGRYCLEGHVGPATLGAGHRQR
jgi:hypothetical protein